MVTVALNVAWLSLYESKSLDADIFVLAIVYGLGTTFGTLMSGALLQSFQDKKIYCVSLLLIILVQLS